MVRNVISVQRIEKEKENCREEKKEEGESRTIGITSCCLHVSKRDEHGSCSALFMMPLMIVACMFLYIYTKFISIHIYHFMGYDVFLSVKL